jgi:hypothetical protein
MYCLCQEFLLILVAVNMKTYIENFSMHVCERKLPGINPENIRNLKAEDDDAGPNGLVEYRVVPGDGSDRQTKPNRAP